MLKKIFFVSICLFQLSACVVRQEEVSATKKVQFNQVEIGDDCSFYVTYFDEGDYVFRYALSGECKNISFSDYLAEYSRALDSQRARVRNGLLIIDFYSEMGMDSTILNNFIGSTKMILVDYNVTEHELESERLVLKIRKP